MIKQLLNAMFGKKKKKCSTPVQITTESCNSADQTKKKLSPTIIQNAYARKDQIIELIEQDLTLAQIKVRLGISREALKKYMEVLGVKPKVNVKIKKRHHLANQIGKYRKQGYNFSEIGLMVGMTRERIRQIVNEYYPELVQIHKTNKIEINKIQPSKKNKKRLNRDHAIKIMSLRKQSKTWNQVAKALNIGYDGTALRIKIGRDKNLIFTEEERREFFPLKTEPAYKP
jgi:hypothetical protein